MIRQVCAVELRGHVGGWARLQGGGHGRVEGLKDGKGVKSFRVCQELGCWSRRGFGREMRCGRKPRSTEVRLAAIGPCGADGNAGAWPLPLYGYEQDPTQKPDISSPTQFDID